MHQVPPPPPALFTRTLSLGTEGDPSGDDGWAPFEPGLVEIVQEGGGGVKGHRPFAPLKGRLCPRVSRFSVMLCLRCARAQDPRP